MSENLQRVQRAHEHFVRTGEIDPDYFAPDFAWDMSQFTGWPERQIYPGVEGARTFLHEWRDAWDEWTLELQSLHDAGDDVVAVMRQVGRSKTSGLRVEMVFAMVWTLDEGRVTRMRMYADPAEALAAVGLPAYGTNTP